MRLLYCSSSFGGGGITSYTLEFIKSLSGRFEIYVVIGSDDLCPISADNVTVFHLDMDDLSKRNAGALFNVIEEVKPDVVFNNHAPLLSLLTPYMPDNIKVVSVSHNLYGKEVDIALFNNAYIDTVIALGEINRKRILSRYGIHPDKVEVVYNFVNDLNEADSVMASKSASGRPMKIVFPGGGSGTKNPEYVMAVALELMSQPDDFEFYWLGDSRPPKAKVSLLSDIKKVFDDKRFIFPGHISRSAAEDILMQANIFILPSRREGCPMSMLEALRGGAICFTTDIPTANVELIDRFDAGYVCPATDPDLCAAKIIEIIRNPEQYKRRHALIVSKFAELSGSEKWCNEMISILTSPRKGRRDKRRFTSIGYIVDRFRLKCQLYRSSLYRLYAEQLASFIRINCRYIKYICR